MSQPCHKVSIHSMYFSPHFNPSPFRRQWTQFVFFKSLQISMFEIPIYKGIWIESSHRKRHRSLYIPTNAGAHEYLCLLNLDDADHVSAVKRLTDCIHVQNTLHASQFVRDQQFSYKLYATSIWFHKQKMCEKHMAGNATCSSF